MKAMRSRSWRAPWPKPTWNGTGEEGQDKRSRSKMKAALLLTKMFQRCPLVVVDKNLISWVFLKRKPGSQLF
jgi:hypothetical protein